MNHPEPLSAQPVTDRVAREAEGEDLIAPRRSLLPASQSGQASLPLEWTWVARRVLYAL